MIHFRSILNMHVGIDFLFVRKNGNLIGIPCSTREHFRSFVRVPEQFVSPSYIKLGLRDWTSGARNPKNE